MNDGRLRLRSGRFARALAIACIVATTAVLASCASAPPADDAVSGASPAGRDTPAIAAEIGRVENGPRTLVVYFSQGSAVKRVADDIAYLLGADTDRIVETQSRSGFFGFLGAGADSSLEKSTPIEAPFLDPSLYERVVVCTPVWAFRLAPPVRTWLQQMRGKLPVPVFVVVSAITSPEEIVAMMENASEKSPLAFAGFVQNDFSAENRAVYVRKLATLIYTLR
jgi:hypothetical protein